LLNAHRATAAIDELPSGRDRGASESPMRPIVWKIGAAGAKLISPQAKFVHSAAERGPKAGN
jgi:hypothetical protein